MGRACLRSRHGPQRDDSRRGEPNPARCALCVPTFTHSPSVIPSFERRPRLRSPHGAGDRAGCARATERSWEFRRLHACRRDEALRARAVSAVAEHRSAHLHRKDELPPEAPPTMLDCLRMRETAGSDKSATVPWSGGVTKGRPEVISDACGYNHKCPIARGPRRAHLHTLDKVAAVRPDE